MLKRAAVALLLALGASAAAHEEADSPRAEVPLRRAGGASFVKVADGAPVAPKVRVSASPGQPPALLLENLGREPVIVLGAHDEPFLRISASGVDGNLASPTFKALGRYQGLAVAKRAGVPHWQRVSPAPRYAWPEPRAASEPAQPGPRAWQVPVMVGARRAAIRGSSEWAAK